MGKLLAACLLCASSSCIAFSAPWAAWPEFLQDRDIKNPVTLVHWLTEFGPKTDRTEARWLFSYGLKEKARKNWGAAGKGFGESMMRYPSPEAISEFTSAVLLMLGQVRARERFTVKRYRLDMTDALEFYEASLVANSVTKSLPSEDAERIAGYVSCMKDYLANSKRSQDACPPLTYLSTKPTPRSKAHPKTP